MKLRQTGIWILALLLILSAAGAEQVRGTVLLPDGSHQITLPDGMEPLPVDETVSRLQAVYGMENLELEIFSYAGNGLSLQENAQQLTEAGIEAEIRRISEVDFLVYRETDEADGARCIGYMYPVEDRFIELSFWYGSREAGEMSAEIMGSFRTVAE